MVFFLALVGASRRSLKGDVKKKHFALSALRGSFSDTQPLLAAAILFARAWFSFSPWWELLGVIFLRVFPSGFCCACKQRVGGGQPWFYLRLVAYGFVGLSEGAYGGP